MRFTYRESADEAKTLVDALRAAAPELDHGCHRLPLDDADAVEIEARAIAGTLGRLDVLVHNASAYASSPLQTLEASACRRAYEVNALAPLMLTKVFAPLLARSPLRGGGAIVCMCDIHASERPRRDFLAYSMSKAALEQMVRGLALDLAPGVRVNGVAPGVVAFPEEGYESDPAMQERYLKRVPLARSGTVEEAAEAVRWLALDATYTTGQILRVDGGRWLA